MNIMQIIDKQFISNSELEILRNSSEVIKVEHENDCVEYEDYVSYVITLDDNYRSIVYIPSWQNSI